MIPSTQNEEKTDRIIYSSFLGTGRKRGLRLDNISPIESSKCGAQSLADLVNGVSTAEDTGMLTQVMLVEGDEKEHLGELDLHQLDSFK